MTTLYHQKGTSFYVVDERDTPAFTEVLPPMTFAVKITPAGYHLELTDDFVMPSKIYGDSLRHADRIFTTFMDRSNSTGVLLAGEKGSGKTLLSKLLSIKGAELKMPTIVINEPHTGEGFNAFIQRIEQPTIIIFDEFEKVYEMEQQKAMLTLFDGVYASKKLFILTTNSRWGIDQHLQNRPGRMYYMIEFDGLSELFITQYCEDVLKDKSQIKAVVNMSSAFYKFNFDMLKAIVEEMNRYGETPSQAIKILNVRIDNERERRTFDVAEAKIDGVDVTEFVTNTKLGINPLTDHFEIDLLFKEGNVKVRFAPTDLKSISSGTYEYLTETTIRDRDAVVSLKLKTVQATATNFESLF